MTKPTEPMDLNRLSGLLRKLSPRQEKVIRLYFGLGCERTHSAREIAGAFGASAQAIAGILGAAQRNLAAEGVTASDLREAARCQGESRHAAQPLTKLSRPFRPVRHSHRH